jgi:hypothetical protein
MLLKIGSGLQNQLSLLQCAIAQASFIQPKQKARLVGFLRSRRCFLKLHANLAPGFTHS